MLSYSDDELLEAIQELAEEYGRPPSLQEITSETKYGRKVFYSHFGSWRDALEEAGYEPRPPQEKVSKDDLVEELQRLSDELGKRPTMKEMAEHGEYAPTTYQRAFGSWLDALREVGYDPDPKLSDAGTPKLEKEILIEDLRELADDLEKQPSQRDMNEHGDHSHTTYVRHFGSWTEAIEEAFEDE